MDHTFHEVSQRGYKYLYKWQRAITIVKNGNSLHAPAQVAAMPGIVSINVEHEETKKEEEEGDGGFAAWEAWATDAPNYAAWGDDAWGDDGGGDDGGGAGGHADGSHGDGGDGSHGDGGHADGAADGGDGSDGAAPAAGGDGAADAGAGGVIPAGGMAARPGPAPPWRGSSDTPGKGRGKAKWKGKGNKKGKGKGKGKPYRGNRGGRGRNEGTKGNGNTGSQKRWYEHQDEPGAAATGHLAQFFSWPQFIQFLTIKLCYKIIPFFHDHEPRL